MRVKSEKLVEDKEYIYLADFGATSYFLPKEVSINIVQYFESIKNWKAGFIFYGMQGNKINCKIFPINNKKC